MSLPITVDLTYDFLACLFALGMVTFVLLVGAVTRTSAVVGVSIGLLFLGGIVFGIWFTYRLDGASEPLQFERTILRTLVGLAVLLLIVQGYVLFRLIRRRRRDDDTLAMPSMAGSPQAGTRPVTERYDRDWLLSLLQHEHPEAGEKITKGASGSTPPAESPGDTDVRKQ